MLVFFPALIAGPSAAQNRTMKTPCLKCGLIHEEPTAICDGYAGIDPEETAGGTRKKAAERIRAVLAAVPIESRAGGRTRAAAAGAGAHTSSPASIRHSAGGSVQTDAPPPEVPEWRREVTERLESYRSRRERQARQGNQTVLGFRVHSRTETLEESAETEATAAAPTAPTEMASEAIVPHTIAEVAAQDVAAAAAHNIEAGPGPAESATGTVPVDSVSGTSAIPKPSNDGLARNGEQAQRVYQPIEESDVAQDLTTTGAEAAEHEVSATCCAESSETTIVPAAEAYAAATALPLATEPAVVLADSTTLEVHAGPAELEEAQPLAPPGVHMAIDSIPLATIPSIDTEYWRAQPGPAAETIGETEECGSLTSGFEARADRRAAGAIEEAAEEAPAALPVFSEALDEPPASPAAAEHAAEASAETAARAEPLFPGALETSEEEEDGFDPRRAALRTAARPLPGTAPERIEINVPQPVFDFSATSVQSQQPQEQGPPVADLRERRCAAIFDAIILGLTIGGFFAVFHLAGGEFSFSRVGAAVGIATTFLIYAQYILLFTMVGGATPGMLLRGLHVVCFDGRPPDQAELTWRAFGYLLSAAAGMLGFVWSAWDEHGLTWHDRISQTYITYAEAAGDPVAASAS
jgi:uncharacterized RDD family membrane protein YckC